MPLRHWLQLALTDGIGPILTARLIATAGSAEAAATAGASLLQTVEGIGSSKARSIAASLKQAAGEVEAELQRCDAGGVKLVCYDDDDYPVILRAIPDPPSVLYVKGDVQPRDLNAVAIVGSRRCSHYGREQAERFAALLAGAGVTVVSGGARGVDSAAHRGAMSHPLGRTVAVLGCGVDVIYPPENGPLFDQVAERGAVMSEFPMGTPPLRDNFPRRNRIVSGLSRGVLVIEADVKSGALITARQACDDHGRPVFAVPGRVDNPLSAGPHLLIRDGATLAACLDDVIDGLGPLPVEAVNPAAQGHVADAPPLFDVASPGNAKLASTTNAVDQSPRANFGPDRLIGLTDRQRLVLEGLGREATGVDGVISRTDLPAEVVLQELTLLTLRGLVKRVDGQSFVRR